MKQQDLIILYVTTIVLDIVLLYILYSNVLVLFDRLFIWAMLIVHVLFYYALFSEWRILLNILHYVLFVSLCIGIFLQDCYLLCLCLGLVFLIQILWIFEDRCILNETPGEFGYDEWLSSGTLLWTMIYAWKLGYTYGLFPSSESETY